MSRHFAFTTNIWINMLKRQISTINQSNHFKSINSINSVSSIQSINQSIHQSMNHFNSINQFNQSINQPINSISRFDSINESINQPVNQSMNQDKKGNRSQLDYEHMQSFGSKSRYCGCCSRCCCHSFEPTGTKESMHSVK